MKLIITFLILSLAVEAHATNWYVDNSLASSANTGASAANAWTNLSSVTWYQNGFGSIVGGSVGYGDTLHFTNAFGTNAIYSVINYPATNIGAMISIGFGASNNPLTVVSDVKVIFDGGGDAMSTNAEWNAHAMNLAAFDVLNGTNHGFLFRNWANTNAAEATGSAYKFTTPLVTAGTSITIRNVTTTNTGCAIDCAGDHLDIGWSTNYFDRGDHIISVTPVNSFWDICVVQYCHLEGTTHADLSGTGPDGISASGSMTVHDCELFCLPNDGTIGTQHPDAYQGGGNFIKFYNNKVHCFLNSSFSSDPNPPLIHDKIYANNLFIKDQPYSLSTVINEGSDSMHGLNTPYTAISNIWFLNNTTVGYGYGNGYQWDKSPGLRSFPIVTNFCEYNNLNYVSSNRPTFSVLGFDNYYNPNFNSNAIVTVSCVGYGIHQYHQAVNTIARSSNPVDVYWTPAGMNTSAPQFLNYSGGDFHLAANDTIAHGQGTNLTALFVTLGIPATDLDGNVRTNSGAWDIGAYGIGAGGGTSATSVSNVK